MSFPILFFYGFAFLGIVHSLFFSYLTIKNKRIVDFIITLYLLVQSLIITEYVIYWAGLYAKYHYAMATSIPLHFLFGPLLFVYIDFVLLENKRVKKYFVHFVPFLLVLIIYIPFYFSSGDMKLNHSNKIEYFLNVTNIQYFIMIHMVFYFLFLMGKLISQKRVGYINKWLITLVSLFGFYIACYISYYYMVKKPWFTLKEDYYVSLGMCASIVSIIYIAYGKKRILDGYRLSESIGLENIYFTYKEIASKEETKKKEIKLVFEYASTFDTFEKNENFESTKQTTFIESKDEKNESQFIKYKNSGLTEDASNELAEILDSLMQKEKLYRNSELKLELLAEKIGTAKHYLSQVINQIYGVNFFEYINLLRINEAKELLVSTDKKTLTIIEIAYTVGYNHKNTFNTAFRRIVGTTPTEFRIKNKIAE